MKNTFLIISAVVLTTLVACKKETTTNTTSGTNSATVNYGTYSGGDFTIKTVGITYKKDGSIDQNTPKQESTMVMPSTGYATITKGSNNTILLTGGGFSAAEMKFNGTAYTIDKKITSAINSMTKTVEGFGTLINKDLTINNKTITTTVTSVGNGSVSYYDSTVITQTITGSVHLVE